jgi:transposase
MARPKSVFSGDLAASAKADMALLDHHKILQKLQAIVAAASFPIDTVAQVMGIAAETIWRWAKAYQKNGLEGLYPSPKKPKPSKLTNAQKDEVLAWLDKRSNSAGERMHWTLERLQYAIMKKFGVTLGITSIWAWLRREKRVLKVPRPQHAKADMQAQEAVKKTSRNGKRPSGDPGVFL